MYGQPHARILSRYFFSLSSPLLPVLLISRNQCGGLFLFFLPFFILHDQKGEARKLDKFSRLHFSAFVSFFLLLSSVFQHPQTCASCNILAGRKSQNRTFSLSIALVQLEVRRIDEIGTNSEGFFFYLRHVLDCTYNWLRIFHVKDAALFVITSLCQSKTNKKSTCPRIIDLGRASARQEYLQYDITMCEQYIYYIFIYIYFFFFTHSVYAYTR